MIGKILDRYLWVADLVIIAVFASLLASGVDHLLTGVVDGFIQGAMTPDPVGHGKTKRPGQERNALRDDFVPVTGADILARNIFDSETGPLDGSQSQMESLLQTPSEGSEADPDAIPPMCTGPLVLTASYASEDFPEYSFVSIRQENQTKVLQVGESIGGYTVEKVTWRYVFLAQPGGTRCYLDIWNEAIALPSVEASAMGKPMTPAEKMAMAGGIGTSAADFQDLIDKSIKDLSPTEKDIDSSLIEYLAQNKAMLTQAGRVLPNVEGDQINGFKVYGIRKTSLWGKLGIHNGDVILSVNGLSMDGPDKAYDAFTNLGGSDSMDVEVMRHGKPVSFTYHIK